MEPQTTSCGSALTDMELKARELSKNGGLRSYLVVLREIRAGKDGKPEMTVRSLCFTAPSASHITAKYDQPECGIEIMKFDFLAMGEVSVVPLAWKGRMAEITDLSGLNMCYNCIHDFRMNPERKGDDMGRHESCTFGHRMDGELATKMCKGFQPKVA